jgi:hypothetical protein
MQQHMFLLSCMGLGIRISAAQTEPVPAALLLLKIVNGVGGVPAVLF